MFGDVRLSLRRQLEVSHVRVDPIATTSLVTTRNRLDSLHVAFCFHLVLAVGFEAEYPKNAAGLSEKSSEINGKNHTAKISAAPLFTYVSCRKSRIIVIIVIDIGQARVISTFRCKC